MSDDKRPPTPRSLAAILNPDAPRPASSPGHDDPRAEEPFEGGSAAADLVGGNAIAEPRARATEWMPGVNRKEEHAPVLAHRSRRSMRELVQSGEGEIELLLFRGGSETFAIPLHDVDLVQDSVELFHLPSLPENVVGMMRLGDRSCPVFNPMDLLGVALAHDRPAVLSLQGERGSTILAVDAVVSSVRVDWANIRRVIALEDPGGVFVGVFFHGSTLVSVLDAAAFLGSRAQYMGTPVAGEAATAGGEA